MFIELYIGITVFSLYCVCAGIRIWQLAPYYKHQACLENIYEMESYIWDWDDDDIVPYYWAYGGKLPEKYRPAELRWAQKKRDKRGNTYYTSWEM